MKRASSLTEKQFLGTMMVLIFAELADSLCGVIDGVMVGRFLGSDAIAAHGVAAPVFLILCIFSFIITVGFQQPCTVCIGKGDLKKADGLFSMTVLLALAVSLALGLAGSLFPRAAAYLLGARDSVILEMSADYLQGVFIGVPALLLFLVLIPVLQLDGQWRLVRIGSVVMCLSDIGIDLLNVFVLKGGMLGMGLATSLSYYLGLGVLLIYFLRKDRLFHFRRADIDWSRAGSLLRTGLPSGVQEGARAFSEILVTAFVMSSLGAACMAALGVQRNLSTMFTTVAIGISGAVIMLGGISYGERDRLGLMDVVRMAARTCILEGGIICALLFASAPFLVHLYMDYAAPAFPLAVFGVRCMAFWLPLYCWTRSVGAYLQGIEKREDAMAVYILSDLVLPVASVWIMGSLWGARGLFLAFPLGQVLLTAALNLYFYVRRDRRYTGMEAYLGVDSSFGVPLENRLSRVLTTREEVWALAEEAQGFCLERGVSRENANLVSIFIEEMGNIIMLYCFSGEKSNKLEVRLSLHHDMVILRMRDDCPRFDITEKSAHWQEDPEHPEVTYGVRMVMKASKVIIYNNSLKTNNLMVVF